jgi:GTP pyrophosphokinase
MKKQQVGFDEIYDVFAIRIIIDSESKNEKSDCWRVYSIVTDLYQPNPQRLRDWISVPKSNGYESLHTTVIGPGGTWVEVQIRTRRMDEIAEKGFAAHWKYKGVRDDNSLDQWLGRVRELLEMPASDATEILDELQRNPLNEEVFVFTPKGDLRKFPQGATVLDFAFDIHTEVGCSCVGAKVNGKNVPIRYVLRNGDKVEILQGKAQKPKSDWLDVVVTSKAKTRIRQFLKEEVVREAEHGKELLMRRMKNWKIEYNDENIRKLLDHYKLKTSSDLFYRISVHELDLADIKNILTHREVDEGATEQLQPAAPSETITVPQTRSEDFLIIDDKIKNVDYRLAKCCSPVPGDEIFGFVTVGEGIKIHRINCPNARQLLQKYGYRVVKAHWKYPEGAGFFEAVIRITGIDELGVINKLTDVISRDLRVNMRSLSIDAKEGIYEGFVRVMVRDKNHLNELIHRLAKVKGVLTVSRVEGR